MSGTNDDVFGDEQNKDDAGNQPGNKGGAPGDQADLFDQLVGDGKKFKTKEDLAKAKLEADRFIEQLKSEQAQIRTDFANLQEVVKTLSKNGGAGNPAGASGQPAVDTSNLEETVARVLESRTQAQTREQNLKASVETLVQTLGSQEAAKAAIQKRAAELGVTPKKLQEDAATSPQYFLSVMGVTGKAAPTAVAATKPSQSSAPVRTGASSGVPGKSHFDELRKTNPREYYSPKVQNALFKARVELGEQFYQL